MFSFLSFENYVSEKNPFIGSIIHGIYFMLFDELKHLLSKIIIKQYFHTQYTVCNEISDSLVCKAYNKDEIY